MRDKLRFRSGCIEKGTLLLIDRPYATALSPPVMQWLAVRGKTSFSWTNSVWKRSYNPYPPEFLLAYEDRIVECMKGRKIPDGN